MLGFVFEQNLSSYEITLNALKDIEKYLLEDLPKILKIKRSDIADKISISIQESVGEESINKMSDYRLHKFPDDTKRISIELYTHSPKLIRISITFSLEKDSTNIRITLDGEKAREFSLAINQGMIRVLDCYKTNNYLFNLPSASEGILTGALFPLFGFAIIMTISPNVWGIILLSISTIITLYLTIGKKMHPYTSFESNKTNKYKKWHNWFLFGFVGFMVFDIILLLVLRFLIGI